MTKESLVLILELLSSVRLGSVMEPDFEEKVNKLVKLKKEVELELNGKSNSSDSTS